MTKTRVQKIKKLLIENRGEIAIRIQRACKALNIKAVTIASDADKSSLVARLASELIIVGAGPSAESYLSIDRIIGAALERKCDSIHPGYGFLSENAEFASKVRQAGLIFVGPDPETIKLMGSKTEARARVSKNGVPVVPGSKGGLGDVALISAATEIGFPIIIKAAAGGGGRGMRICRSKAELESILPSARAEVKKNFGSDEVFIESFIEMPRHVEVQVFGDANGNVVHLGTRDCSTQRRHQKLVEEAPAPNLSADLRSRIESAAVNAAKSVNYKNAGTVEFLVAGEKFYFLEMNTRIQVEHPVTEEVTGIDLVQLQLKVAMGAALPFKQKDIKLKGHAIEFRINAEDVRNNFAPAIGEITTFDRPKFPWARAEVGYEAGDAIPLYYDGLIAKLIIKGRNRDDAIAKSLMYLSRCVILGVPTSLDLDRWLIENGMFKSGTVDIGFIEREFTPNAIKALGASPALVPETTGRPKSQKDVIEYFKRELRTRELWDPNHKLARGGAQEVEDKHCYEYESKKFKTKYTIEVLHRKDGFFQATPVDSKGRRARNKDCRMSNGLDMVVRSLIADVLEKTPPAELFTDM